MTVAFVTASTGVIVALAVVAWFLLGRGEPEPSDPPSSVHSDRAEPVAEQFYRGVDRPAGPDAETMDPDMLGGDHRPPDTATG